MTLWTRVCSGGVATKSKIRVRCRCGTETHVRVSDVLAGGTRQCKACATRAKMSRIPATQRLAQATAASTAASVKAKATPHPLVRAYGPGARAVMNVMSSAKQRCTNANDVAYPSYGGRGIQFDFPSPHAAAEWVLYNLGMRPSPGHSIDRVDNNRHYEAGNLRWATRSEQAQNKRAYKRGVVGERIRALQEIRPDLTYETLRQWIKQGHTDADIIGRQKYARSSL